MDLSRLILANTSNTRVGMVAAARMFTGKVKATSEIIVIEYSTTTKMGTIMAQKTPEEQLPKKLAPGISRSIL
jgi:hypothetical protein